MRNVSPYCFTAWIIAFGCSPVLAEDSLAQAKDLCKKGKFQEAQGVLTQALKKNPADAAAHYLLGNTLVSLGKTADAKTEYERADALDPKGKAGEYARLALSNIQSQADMSANTTPRSQPNSQASSVSSKGSAPWRHQGDQSEAIDRLTAERDARIAQIQKDSQERIKRLNSQLDEDIAANGSFRRGRINYNPTQANNALKSDNSAQIDQIKKETEKQTQTVRLFYEEKLRALQ